MLNSENLQIYQIIFPAQHGNLVLVFIAVINFFLFLFNRNLLWKYNLNKVLWKNAYIWILSGNSFLDIEICNSDWLSYLIISFPYNNVLINISVFLKKVFVKLFYESRTNHWYIPLLPHARKWKSQWIY